MYAELPAPAPRGRRRDRRPEGATTPVPPEASAQAPETSSEPVTSTVASKAPVSQEPAAEEPPKAHQEEPTAPVAEAPREQDTEKPEEKPQPKAQKAVRPEREPRFRPRGTREQKGGEPETGRGPRREKPVAKRWARTQADGPRDGSESHHAAPITARPIYAPGRRGPISAEWSPGQGDA